jgi:hypothetical protein
VLLLTFLSLSSPRAWNLWTKQVDLNPLYTNDLRNGAPATAPGF